MRLLLIDANNLYHRAWHAQAAKSSKVVPSLVVNMCREMVSRLRRDHIPDFTICCWDGGRDEERLALHNDYKAGRPERDDEFYEGMRRFKALLEEASNCVQTEHKGVEADDTIATIARHFDSPDNVVIVVTDDKDLRQLISNNVVVLHPRRGYIMDTTKFREEFGFDPPLFADYLALVGDSTDNIPGARGIGEKGAKDLVQRFGTIEFMLENLNIVPEKYRNKLQASYTDVLTAKKLVSLKTIDLQVPWLVF